MKADREKYLLLPTGRARGRLPGLPRLAARSRGVTKGYVRRRRRVFEVATIIASQFRKTRPGCCEAASIVSGGQVERELQLVQ